MNLDQYYRLLTDVYGESLVKALTIQNYNTLRLKTPPEINEFIDKYERREDEGCQHCKGLLKGSFVERKMDFISWLNVLDFGKKHVKKIMMIGEDVSPKIPKCINISYGIGRYPIMSDGRMKEEKRNELWVCMKNLFNNLDLIKENIYMTDISKCNASKDRTIWTNCSEKFLINEIKLIRPILILFQGNTAYDFTKSLLRNDIQEEDVSSYFRDNNFPKFGKITFPDNDMLFLKIYHTSVANRRHRNKNIDDYRRLIKDRILPTITQEAEG